MLTAQGYGSDPISQYQQVCVLGQGGFGRVLLVEHKNSKIKYALKQIKKSLIERTFVANGETFSEVEVLKTLTR